MAIFYVKLGWSMLLRESKKVIYDRALERLDKVIQKAKQLKLLEQGAQEGHLRFTGYSLGIFDQLLRITTEKFLLVPDYSLKADHNRNIINPELLRKKSQPNLKSSFRDRLRNTSFTIQDFIHDQGPFEWPKLSTAALDEACAILSQFEDIQPAATTSFYKFMHVETETTGKVYLFLLDIVACTTYAYECFRIGKGELSARTRSSNLRIFSCRWLAPFPQRDRLYTLLWPTLLSSPGHTSDWSTGNRARRMSAAKSSSREVVLLRKRLHRCFGGDLRHLPR